MVINLAGKLFLSSHFFLDKELDTDSALLKNRKIGNFYVDILPKMIWRF